MADRRRRRDVRQLVRDDCGTPSARVSARTRKVMTRKRPCASRSPVVATHARFGRLIVRYGGRGEEEGRLRLQGLAGPPGRCQTCSRETRTVGGRRRAAIPVACPPPTEVLNNKRTRTREPNVLRTYGRGTGSSVSVVTGTSAAAERRHRRGNRVQRVQVACTVVVRSSQRPGGWRSSVGKWNVPMHTRGSTR